MSTFITLETHLIKGKWETMRIEHNLKHIRGMATAEIGKVDEDNNWQGSGHFFLIKPNNTGRRVQVNHVRSSIRMALASG